MPPPFFTITLWAQSYLKHFGQFLTSCSICRGRTATCSARWSLNSEKNGWWMASLAVMRLLLEKESIFSIKSRAATSQHHSTNTLKKSNLECNNINEATWIISWLEPKRKEAVLQRSVRVSHCPGQLSCGGCDYQQCLGCDSCVLLPDDPTQILGSNFGSTQ